MKKLLLYYSFILSILLVVLGFLGAKTPAELVSALVFAPLGLYFWLLIFPTKKQAVVLKTKAVVAEKRGGLKVAAEEGEIEPGLDVDRRKFLKLIGSAGASLFLLAVFTKKAEAAFFGSVPGPGTVGIKDASGTRINPAEKLPTDGYNISKIDDTSSPAYYGFLNKDGGWFIMKEDGGDYTYARGDSNFSSNWANRASLTYGTFDEVF
jgi:hypothetical protein